MKRAGSFIAGLICGALIFCGMTVYAAGILAEPSTHRVFINGEEIQVEGYLIDGHNYYKLRDIGEAVGFAVDWNEDDRTVQISCGQPCTGTGQEESFTEEVNPAVLTGAYTREAYEALRSAIVTGAESEPVYLSEETYQAMLEAEAAIGCWPVYDLNAKGNHMYSCLPRYPEPYEEAAAYCKPYIDSLAGLTEREKVRQIAFYVCDRLEYSANATSTPRTALVDDGVHQGNCMSYAHNFKFLCDLAGIPCIFVHSEDHQWNQVFVEGRWWHVDVSSTDSASLSWRYRLPVLEEESDMQGSSFVQSQPQLTNIAKELVVPGSSK